MATDPRNHDCAPPDAKTGRRALQRTLVLALLLVAAWVLWSGFFKPLLLGLGAVSCVLTLIVVRRMGYFDNETYAFNYGWRLFGFWAWLGKEILNSSIEVTKIVLRRRLEVQPQVIEIDASHLDVVDQATLGNSITLTPGTLTLDAHDGRLLVHALGSASASSLQQGEMQRRVAALRRG